MTEKKTYTEEELAQKIKDAQEGQARFDYGRQWFLECLAHTANLVNQGAFPQEAHKMGQVFFQQFMMNMGAPQVPPAVKKEEKEPVE
jgi:hypothetical protein